MRLEIDLGEKKLYEYLDGEVVNGLPPGEDAPPRGTVEGAAGGTANGASPKCAAPSMGAALSHPCFQRDAPCPRQRPARNGSMAVVRVSNPEWSEAASLRPPPA
jgi:hypothetical protein